LGKRYFATVAGPAREDEAEEDEDEATGGVKEGGMKVLGSGYRNGRT
jgi:hypothetical protein